ncbi:MAG: penicillin acylase family protein [Pirellulales bacterium]
MAGKHSYWRRSIAWLVAWAMIAAAVITMAAAPLAVAADGEALARQVTIRRTEYGVPHIQGETLEAAAFGFGYCQAEDHLQNIMRGVIGARGELAITFGPDDGRPGDRKNVEADFRARRYRIHARAVENYHRMDADYRSMVEGFAAGLNFYVARHRAQLPEWMPEVTPHDVAAYGLAGVMRFAFDRRNLVRDFLKSQGDGNETTTARLEAGGGRLEEEGVHASVSSDENRTDRDASCAFGTQTTSCLGHPDVETGRDASCAFGTQTTSCLGHPDVETGSNMWAFAPSRSRTGRTLLLGNPHQAWAPVSTYYEAHMIVPGKLNFYGSTFIGRPVLTSGWNEHLGWSHTVNYPDLEEIYELELDPQRPEHYRFDGGSAPIAADVVTIRIKGEGEPQSETRTFWHTPLGPVIHRTAAKIYVMRSACYENYRAYEQWLRMTQTTSYDEFRRVLEMNQIPMFNIAYADRAGNIFYLWNGTVPKLPHAGHKAEAVPAARTSDIWTEFHATADLPQLFNPAGGYVQNCNSPPFLTNLRAPLDPAKYPSYFPANNLSLRTQHSLRLIDNDEKLTLEQMCEMKHSPLMLGAERVKQELIEALRNSQPNSEIAAAIDVLENWDNRVSADSRGGTLFENWWNRTMKQAPTFAVAWSAAEPTSTPHGLVDPQEAVKNFSAALEEVTRNHGRADVAWGEAHRLRKGPVDLPISGGSGLAGCFRVLGFRQDADHKLVANTGDSFVFAVEFSQPPKAYTVLAYSQSDVEGSPHFADQAPLFSAGKMKRAAFTDEEIAAQLLRSYHPGEE